MPKAGSIYHNGRFYGGGSSGGGSEGHTIYDSFSTTMPARTGLLFDGMEVEDDETNDKTIVHSPIDDTKCTPDNSWSAEKVNTLKADKSDLASISITGTTNNTGSSIASGTYFYLNGTLVQATAAIASGSTLTSGTNYSVVTAGGLNKLNTELSALQSKVNLIGTVYSANLSGNTSGSSSSYTHVAAQLTLPAGTYILSVNGRFSDNASTAGRAFITLAGQQIAASNESLLRAIGFTQTVIATFTSQTTTSATFFFEGGITANAIMSGKFMAIRIK